MKNRHMGLITVCVWMTACGQATTTTGSDGAGDTDTQEVHDVSSVEPAEQLDIAAPMTDTDTDPRAAARRGAP